MNKAELITKIADVTDTIEYIEKEVHNVTQDSNIPIATKSLIYQRLQLGLNCAVMKYQIYKDLCEISKEEK
jgi:exosome complex RNA-binding protein Rrp4